MSSLAVFELPLGNDVLRVAAFALCLVLWRQLRLLLPGSRNRKAPGISRWMPACLLAFAIGNMLPASVFPGWLQSIGPLLVVISLGVAAIGLMMPSLTLASTAQSASGSEPEFGERFALSVRQTLGQDAKSSAAADLELALDAGGIGLWEWNLESGKVVASPGLRSLLKLSRSTRWSSIEDWQSHIHPDDRESVSRDLTAFVNGRVSTYEFTHQMTTAKGDVLWLCSRARKVLGEQGQVSAVHGVVLDVTERRRMRQQLRLSKFALSMSDKARLVIQANGRVIQANDSASQLLLRSKERLCDLTIFDIDANLSQGTWQDHLSTLDKRKVHQTIVTVRLPGHRQLRCETRQSAIVIDGAWFVIWTATDLSATRGREPNLRRYEFVTERAMEAVYWVDFDGRLIYVNRAACRMLGYSKEELMRMRVSDLNADVTSELWARHWAKLKDLRSMAVETSQRTASGEEIPVAMSLFFYEFDGEQFVVGTSRDTSRERRAKVQLSRKSAELEQLVSLLPLGMVLVDRDRRVVRVNRELCRMFGYESHEIIGQSSQIFYHDYEAYAAAADYQKQLSPASDPQRFLIDFRHKTGRIFRSETAGTKLRGADGETLGYLGLIQDVTDRLVMERSLRRTQKALDAAADAVLWINRDGGIFYANEIACERLQFTKSQLEEMTVADINPTLASAEEFTEQFWPLIQRQGRITVELRHRRKDGSEFPVEIVSHLQKFEGEEFACSFVRDVSERHRAQQQLLDARAKLELALHCGNVWLWEWNIETGVIRLSDEYHRFIGEEPDTITTFPQWKERLHPSDQLIEEEVKRDMSRSSDVQYDRTYRIRHRDGVYRWALSRGRLFRGNEGEPDRLMGAHVDITDLRTAQLRTEAYVNLVGTTDGGWDWAVDSDEVQYSPRFFELLGFEKRPPTDDADDILFLKQLIHPEDRNSFWANIDQHFRTREFFDHEVRLRMKNFQYRWFRFRAQTIFDAQERPLRMAGSIYDVTDQKEVELQLRRSNADLEQFAYVASHDLQEPLRAISGFCYLLKLKYDHLLDDTGREYIDHAVSGATRMKKIIEDLLDYARVGRKLEGNDDVTLNDCAIEAVRRLESTIRDADAEVEIEALPSVDGCTSLLVQLFQNLVSNAVKFRRDEVTPRVTIHGRVIGQNVVIEVVDNGMGMESEYREQIFHLFQRLHHSENIPGTGLGLAICQRIVDRVGGTIMVSSTPNHGSTFTVTLPRKLRT